MTNNKPFSIIYGSRCIITGKWYIGQSKNYNSRKRQHTSSNTKDDYPFHKAILKYGKDNFQWYILHKCDNADEANEMERFYINFYDSYRNGYNATTGGDGVNKLYYSFEESRDIVHELGINSFKEWIRYCSREKKDDFIPSNPQQVYVDEWAGWGNWLGTDRISTKNIEWLPYEKALKYVHKLKLKTQSEWFIYTKSGNKPPNIPANPSSVYYNKGWNNYSEWLGNGKFNKSKVLSYDEAKKYLHPLHIASNIAWRKFINSNIFPTNIPRSPDNYYHDWVSWSDFLGTKNINKNIFEYWPFNKARKYVHSLNIPNQGEWRKYCKCSSKPVNIPSAPWLVYKNNGWIDLRDWLGTKSNYKKEISIDGHIFKSIKKASLFYNQNPTNVARRLRNGWTNEEALGIIIKKDQTIPNSKCITVSGIKYRSISEAARSHNLIPKVVSKRLRSGWTINEAFNIIE